MTDRAPDHHSFELDDGAYLIGALSPHERAAFEAHLRDCPACAASLAELVGLPGLLGRVPADVAAAMDDHVPSEIPGAGPVDPVGPAEPASDAGPHRRRRRVVVSLVAASALVAAFVLGGVARSVTDDDRDSASRPPAQAGLRLAPVARTPLSVTAQLTPVRWGTRITLLCTYAGEAPRESTYVSSPSYALIVKDSRGSAQQVATWRAVPGRSVTVEAATALSPDEITAIEVDASDGTALLRGMN